MRLILPPSKKQSCFSEQPNKPNVDGKTIENSHDIAETFNNQIKSNFYYTRCNTPKRVTSWRGPSSRHCTRAAQLLLKKCRRGREPLATLCPTWPAQDLNLRSPASKTKALPLDQLAGTFYNYFVKVGKTLTDKIFPTPPQTCKKYLRNRIQDLIFFEAPRPNEIFNIINSLKCKKSSKENVKLSYFTRVTGHLPAPYLTYFFRLSFNFGIFPEVPKIIAVTPILKTDPTTKTLKYCPISVFPVCLKFGKHW